MNILNTTESIVILYEMYYLRILVYRFCSFYLQMSHKMLDHPQFMLHTSKMVKSLPNLSWGGILDLTISIFLLGIRKSLSYLFATNKQIPTI